MTRVGRTVRDASRVLALAAAVACSEKAPLPAQLPDCDSGMMCGSTGGQGSGAGSGTGGGGDSGGSCGQITFASQVCNTCVRGACCDRNAKCTANALCLELLRCVNACSATDTACKRACRDQSQNGIADYDNFISCVASGCETECAASDAGSACGVLVFQNTACNNCMNANCCAENAACSNNSDCFALVQCASACPATDQVCLTDCRSQHPNGAAAYTSLNQCGLTNCSTQCQ